MKAFHVFDNFKLFSVWIILPIYWRPLLSPPQSLSYSGHSGNYCLYDITSHYISFHIPPLPSFHFMYCSFILSFLQPCIVNADLIFQIELSCPYLCTFSSTQYLKHDLTIITYNECILPYNHECNLLFNTSHLACGSLLFSATWISSSFSALTGLRFRLDYWKLFTQEF